MRFTARLFLGMVCAALMVLTGRSQDAKPKPKPKDEKAPLVRAIEAMNLPAGAIFVLEDAKEALNLLKYVRLTPEEYKKLQAAQNELKALKLKLAGKDKVTPRSCKLTGSVEGDLARLKAEFAIVTTVPSTRVVLGCQRAWPRSARINGKLPYFVPPVKGEEGLVVLVDQPGDHKLMIDLELPLTARGTKGSEQGFDLGLAYTIAMLDSFSLPGNVGEVKINGQTYKSKLEGGRSRFNGLALGTVEQLDMIWKGSVVRQGGPALLAADGRILVRFEERKHVTSDVEMTLEVLRGETKEWRILLPAHALFQPGALDPRIESIEPPKAREPWLTVRLKAPSSEPLKLNFQIQQVRKGMMIPIGPFTVLPLEGKAQPVRQRGTIAVTAPTNQEVRLRYAPRGEVIQREVPEDLRDQKVVAAFSYWNLPAPANPKMTPPALLDLNLETVKGAVESRGEHALRITENGFYELDCKFVITPHSTGVEQLEIKLPANFPYDERRGPTPVDLDVKIDADKGVAVVMLPAKQTQPFAITLPARGKLAANQRELDLDMPRVLHTFDRGSELTVSVPESSELVDRQVGAELMPPGTHQHIWRWQRTPEKVAVLWRDYQPRLTVDSIVDVTVFARQAVVEQRMDFSFPDEPPQHVQVELPAGIGQPKLVQGGTLRAKGLVRIDNPGPRVSLAFSYVVPLPGMAGGEGERQRQFELPYVRATQATEGKTKVRVWSEPQSRVAAGVLSLEPAGAWQEQHTEIVPGKPALPVLVLTTGQKNARLDLIDRESPLTALAAVMADRALIQVAVTENGEQSYRARFLISRLSTRTLDIGFPTLVGLNLQVMLDGKPIALEVVEATDESGAGQVRLKLPSIERLPVLLEVRYQLAPQGTPGNNALHSTFYPPVLMGDVFLGRVRWQVGVPTGWVPLYQGGDLGAEQNWRWVGGLLTPYSAVKGGELEQWLTGVPARAQQADAGSTGLFCWRTSFDPVRVIQVPRQAWLIGCSLAFLIVGLFLGFAPLSRAVFWALITIIGLTVAYLGVFWPAVLPAVIYGCEPGLAVLLIVLAVHWILQTHYQRQVVFLPGFTRLKAGSVVERKTNSAWPKEPSTVDAPYGREGSGSSIPRG